MSIERLGSAGCSKAGINILQYTVNSNPAWPTGWAINRRQNENKEKRVFVRHAPSGF